MLSMPPASPIRALPADKMSCTSMIAFIPDPHILLTVVAGMLGVASQIGGKVIAEGVETADELRVLVDLGVEWAQGYYLGRPGPLPMGAMIEPLRSWGSLL